LTGRAGHDGVIAYNVVARRVTSAPCSHPRSRTGFPRTTWRGLSSTASRRWTSPPSWRRTARTAGVAQRIIRRPWSPARRRVLPRCSQLSADRASLPGVHRVPGDRCGASSRPYDHRTVPSSPRGRLGSVFTASLRLCARAGMTSIGLVALDGTKLAADAPMSANRTRDTIDHAVDEMFAGAKEDRPTRPTRSPG